MSRDLIPVEGHSNLARDRRTGAIVNLNKSEIEQARARKQMRKQKDQQLERLQYKVEQLADTVDKLLSRLEANGATKDN